MNKVHKKQFHTNANHHKHYNKSGKTSTENSITWCQSLTQLHDAIALLVHALKLLK